MRKGLALFFILLTLWLNGCKPREQTIVLGSEDGGGSGYGVAAQSILRLSDFYGVAKSSTRADNRAMLGSPQYSVAESDAYTLEDGSTVTLVYDEKGVLSDSTYTDGASGESYTLFDQLVLLGVIKSSSGGSSSAGQVTTESDDGHASSGAGAAPQGVFSDATYRREAFDGALSLYLDRRSVLATFGLPNGFSSFNYQKDSYIVDYYRLDDGSLLLLDYGYDRTSLRGAAIRTGSGTLERYLGNWTAQSKPADFVRPSVTVNQITALSAGMTPEQVYEKAGEPMWFEGHSADYRDAYSLSDNSVIYLVYDASHGSLSSAYRVMPDGKQAVIKLR